MSSSSFSSFPPSFSSFPDLEPSPSKETLTHSTEDGQRGKNRDGEHKDKKKKGKVREKQQEMSSRHKTRREEGDLPKHRESTREAVGHRPTDEQPTDNDKRMSEAQVFLDSMLQTRSIYYSDRKGDELTVKYGRLHAGDIPKYNILGREYSCVTKPRQCHN